MQRDWIVPALAGLLCVVPAHAVQYLDVASAQKIIFPKADRFERVSLSPGKSAAQVWRASQGDTRLGFFIVDEVIGKHEYITYAVGIDAKGALIQVEIMDYREAYGSQVREEKWRHQFVGKTSQSPLKLEKDVLNISGATLSCRHVTEGVKRLLELFEAVLKT